MENISRMFHKSNFQRLVQTENSRMVLTLTSKFKCDILRNLLNKNRVRLMCDLRAHIKLSISGNIFSGIEKTVVIFSILEKFFFQKWKLICALRAHISKIHKNIYT